MRHTSVFNKLAVGFLVLVGMSILASWAFAVGETHIFTNDSLSGKTLGAAYTRDTIQISGTKITSATNGFVINADSVTCDFGFGANRDTLEFCTDGSSNRYGITINDGIIGTIISGGHILMDGVDVGNDTTWDSRCILMEGTTNTLLDSVNTTTDGGFECHNILHSNNGYCNNLDIIGGRHISNQFGFNSRMDYDEATIRVAIEGEHVGDDYTVKITDAYITSIHGAIEISENAGDAPLFEVARCSIIVDARNDIWDDQLPTDADWKGSINAQGVGFFWAEAGSSIHDNVILSDSNYWGCDVGIIFEGAQGTESDPIRIYDNTIRISRGLDAFYNEQNGDRSDSKGMKWRDLDAPHVNSYVYIYGNDITVLVDGDNSTDYRTIGGHCLEPQSWWTPASALDNNIRVYDNDLTAIVTSETDRDVEIASCFRFAVDDDDQGSYYDNNNLFYGNRLKSDNIIYTMGIGCFDGGANDVRIYADTISFGDDTTNFSVFAFGNCEWEDQGGNEFIDLTYTGTADDIYWSADSTDDAVGSFYLKRILDIHVRDNGDDPVGTADVWVVNGYSDTVALGTTDGSGDFSDTVTYEYRIIRSGASSGNDSLRASFNDFTIGAQKSADTTVNVSFTVDWTAGGGVDTLTLTETGGGPSGARFPLRFKR